MSTIHIKNNYQRKKLKEQIRQLSPEEKTQLAIKLYSSGNPYKLLMSLFECEIQHLIDLFTYYDIKYCTACKCVHSRSEFHRKNTLDGLNSRCKKDRTKYRKIYYENNKELCILNSIKWKSENKDRVNELRKINNKRPEVKLKNAKYVYDRRKRDPIFKLRMTFSNLLYYHLKTHSNINKRNCHWEILVGYTLNDLVKHLESKFQPGMTWDNYGEWHVDHIVPVSSFNIHELGDIEFKKCWCLENLQPLWAKDNIKKSNKIGPEWGNNKMNLLDNDIVHSV